MCNNPPKNFLLNRRPDLWPLSLSLDIRASVEGWFAEDAFALWCCGGRVVTWGAKRAGGDSTMVQEQLNNAARTTIGGDAFFWGVGVDPLWSIDSPETGAMVFHWCQTQECHPGTPKVQKHAGSGRLLRLIWRANNRVNQTFDRWVLTPIHV